MIMKENLICFINHDEVYEIMKDKFLDTFFTNQIKEHILVSERCLKGLSEPFKNIVSICCSALKKKNTSLLVSSDKDYKKNKKYFRPKGI